MRYVTAYIGVGSNLGDRRDYCSRALGLLAMVPKSALKAYSSVYEAEPVGDVGGPFLNLVAQLDTELPAPRLLDILLETERALGRDPLQRNGARTLDLDLLLYGNQIIREKELIVPHPRMSLRRFVLIPLSEIAPDLQHPVLGQTMAQLLGGTQDTHAVKLSPDPIIPWTPDSSRHMPSCS